MKIIVAPDRYDHYLTASEVTASIGRAVLETFPNADIVAIPVADGSTGTMDAIGFASRAAKVKCPAVDPLGRAIEVDIGLLPSGTITIDAESVAGIHLIAPEDRNGQYTTRGIGMLISAALQIGTGGIIIAAGGDLVDDGGKGAIEEIKDDKRIPKTRFAILTGSKGTNSLSSALCDFLCAEEKDGASTIFDILNFDEKIEGCALVITGEYSAGDGHAAMEAATRAKAKDIPVLSVCADFGNGDVYDAGVAKLALCSDYADSNEEMRSRLSSLVFHTTLYALREIESGLSPIVLPTAPGEEHEF